jgi:hypothetical protein
MHHSLPPIEALEFKASSPILVPRICGLKDYDIVSSALHAERFLIVNLIEQIHLLVVGGSVIF